MSKETLSRKPDIDRPALGRAIRKARRDAGLTQQELAKKLHVDPISVSRWERGANEPSLSKLAKIGRLTGTTISQLVADYERRR